MRAFSLAVLTMLAASCETLEFYRQATAGQWSILHARQSTSELIADEDTDPELKNRLQLVGQILEFARDELALEPGKRYSTFVRIGAESVVWNVFATPEFSTHSTQWCYPIVGCASYRGYFDEREANRYAERLIVKRYDTLVGGVAAYSTLGWFDDPLLSTFIRWPDADLAGLIFHELAHTRVFVPGDTAFNEAFATFVERRGVLQWLRANGDDSRAEQLKQQWNKSDRFVTFLLKWRDELQRLYDQPYDAVAMRLLKSEIFAETDRCYRANRDSLGNQDRFFRRPLNNAQLVPLALYHELMAGFAGLFDEADQSWQTFQTRVAALAQEDSEARSDALERAGRAFRAQNRADQPSIACDALQF